MHSIAPMSLWLAFLAFVAFMLVLDLGVFHRKAHIVGFREAVTWSVIWVVLAAAFNVGVYVYFGADRALEFATGFLIEKVMAVDNMFVFAMIFSTLCIPLAHQHRVLFWGIMGAVALRGAMVIGGGAFLEQFHWTLYAFGALLLLIGLRFLSVNTEPRRPEESAWARAFSKIAPISPRLHDGRFCSAEKGRFVITPLLLALIAVELSDIVFAVDSIPAILAVTEDPFIVFTSNVFAILGLRSMYFVLANLIDYFAYLRVGLAAVLVYIGLTMMLTDVWTIPVGVSLGIIAILIGTSVLASMVVNPAPRR